MRKKGYTIITTLIFTILFANMLSTQSKFLEGGNNEDTRITSQDLLNHSGATMQTLFPKDLFAVTSWAKKEDVISFQFQTNPLLLIEMWALTEEQWYDMPYDGVLTDDDGDYLGIQLGGNFTFSPTHTTKWFIVLYNPSSYRTTEIYIEWGATPYIIITNPTSGTSLLTESALNVEWKSNIGTWVNIDLYRGNTLVSTLKESTYNNEFETVRIPESCIDGDDYRIKITDNYDDTEFDFSAPFTIQRRKITVLFPMESDELVPFTTFTIGWTSLGVGPSARLRIDLLLNLTHIQEISNQTENDGIFKWKVLTEVNLINHTYSHYQIKIQDSETQKYVGLSPFFTITKERFMRITSPVNNNSFTQGKVMNIAWETDSTSFKVNIRLMRGNTIIYDIEPVRNKGYYDWNIPSSIRPGTDYYIFINATDNSVSSTSQTFTIKPKLKQIPSYNFPLFLISIIMGVAMIWKKKIIKTKTGRLI
ncbi:hypothetical protein LCGC14_1216220 [marine sediment metagenome]|uniref:Yeast cell wall synthesis Kre9/Knh1-like N-terminal domain-containing protein n=1 Tax=marine sediment metagenome TaxID=412755 RepID=A0A0F9LCS1_9ZZZZ